MILVAALDNQNGLMFNNRRQSQDRLMRERLISKLSGKKLFLNAYSAEQFASQAAPEQLSISKNFLSEASSGDYCFLENVSAAAYKDKIERIIIYRWNRTYPADFYFDLNLLQEWQKISSADFVGSSHEKITEEIFVRKG
ncbi:MAG: ribonuclease Z [Candidatus Bruticola sp.]